ncbi:MAG: VCBS repeat-containing protein [Acidobacteriota bacterium]
MSKVSAGLRLALSLCLTATIGASSADARREKLELRRTAIELPGAPAVVLPADLDGDGDRDLVLALAYTEWDQLSIEESTEMQGIEGLVEVMTIVPALADRRELRVFLADADAPGGFRAAGDAVPLGPEVLSFARGPARWPVVALTDSGISTLGLDAEGRPTLEPVLEDAPVLAGTGALYPDLNLVHDLDGDGGRDLLLPAPDGLAIYPERDGVWTEASARLRLPHDERRAGRRGVERLYPLPRVEDVTGDGRLDLEVLSHRNGWRGLAVLPGVGGGRFGPPIEPLDDDSFPDDHAVIHVGDLDGDGRAEYVTQESLAEEDAGMRQEMRQAKRPPFRYRLHRSGDSLAPAAEPYRTFEALGYTLSEGGGEMSDGGDGDGGEASVGVTIPGGLQDLDGDGRRDLIALTLDFSMLQAVRILATRTISIGLDFHLHCQGEDGQFRPVPDLDLSGRFKLNLDDIRMSQLSLFDGDFNGDGRADFVQLGRGKTVSIHAGQPGCSYPKKPDLTLRLKDEPRDLALVEIEDIDGDGLSDLRIVHPNRIDEPGVTPPVRLDLYLSGDVAHVANRAEGADR